MASSGAQLPMTQGSDLDPPARKKKKDPLKEEKEAEYKRIRQSLVAKRLAVGNEGALSTQFASLEEARQALRKSSPMIVQDSTIPTTTAEKQFYIRDLIEAVHCNEIAGDNQRFAENWNGKYKSNEEIEAACWEVLEAAIEVTLKGRIHKEQLNKSSTYNCFIDRIAGIIHALKRNKTTCHNIMAPGHIQTLVHKPEAVMTRTESNRAGNANKARKLQDKAAKPNNIPAGDPSTISGNQSSANSTSQHMAPPAPRKSRARATRINRNKTVQNPHTRPNPQITQTRHTPQNNQISQIHHPPQNNQNPQMHHTLQNSWDPQVQHTLQNNQIFQMHRLPQNCLNPQIHHPLQNNQIPQVHHTPANACAASSYLSPGLSSQCSPLTQLQHGFDAGNAYTALGYHQQAQAPRQDGYQFVAVNPADADSNSFQSQQNGSKRGRQAKKRTHVEDNSERSHPNAKRRRC
ncbi:uncharacterized protein BJX67DRAFT_344286 [Aspergillus lucknowensis]|uniref:Uncharacterized protein n=1 Tax=Aspergillus lucknowensis TaxID=176173 RepID=A0ABR4M1P3_9EURO